MGNCNIITQAKSVLITGVVYVVISCGNCTAQETGWIQNTAYIQPEHTNLVVDRAVATAVRFNRLVARWTSEQSASSSITDLALHPAYQEIIGIGPEAIPLIMAELESEGEEPNQWFWALKVITGHDPVQDEDRGNYAKMAQIWADWFQRQEDVG